MRALLKFGGIAGFFVISVGMWNRVNPATKHKPESGGVCMITMRLSFWYETKTYRVHINRKPSINPPHPLPNPLAASSLAFAAPPLACEASKENLLAS